MAASPIRAPDPAPERRLPSRALPPYRYVPGLHPHPFRHPEGHQYTDGSAPDEAPWDPGRPWREDELWLWACELFDQRFWWEAHEAWEALWHQVPAGSPDHTLLQGLIQAAASLLKAHIGHDKASRSLRSRAIERLDQGPRFQRGVDTLALVRALDEGLEPCLQDLVDARGTRHRPVLEGSLVSLVPSTTESLLRMGLGERLVGLTRFCVHPEGVAEGRVKVGGTKEIAWDRLEALRPSIVLANIEENSQEIAQGLDARGLRTWWAYPRTVEEALADLEAMGLLLGVDLDEALRRIRALLTPPEHRFRFAYLIWREPWMAAGEQTFIASMLAAVGGTCAVQGRYPELDPSALDQDVQVLLASEPFPFAQKHVDELVAAGLAPQRLHLVDGELCSWHGLRMEEGLRSLRALAERLAQPRRMRSTSARSSY